MAITLLLKKKTSKPMRSLPIVACSLKSNTFSTERIKAMTYLAAVVTNEICVNQNRILFYREQDRREMKGKE